MSGESDLGPTGNNAFEAMAAESKSEMAGKELSPTSSVPSFTGFKENGEYVEDRSPGDEVATEVVDDNMKWAEEQLKTNYEWNGKDYVLKSAQPAFDPNSIAEAIKNGLSHLAPKEEKAPTTPKRYEKFMQDEDNKEIVECITEYIMDKLGSRFSDIDAVKAAIPQIVGRIDPNYASLQKMAGDLSTKYGLSPAQAFAIAQDKMGEAKASAPAPSAEQLGLREVPKHAKAPKSNGPREAKVEGGDWDPEKAMWDFIRNKKK